MNEGLREKDKREENKGKNREVKVEYLNVTGTRLYLKYLLNSTFSNTKRLNESSPYIIGVELL